MLLSSVSQLSTQCGIPNISQPYRPPWPLIGIALFFAFYCISVLQIKRVKTMFLVIYVSRQLIFYKRSSLYTYFSGIIFYGTTSPIKTFSCISKTGSQEQTFTFFSFLCFRRYKMWIYSYFGMPYQYVTNSTIFRLEVKNWDHIHTLQC
jgi:hypothetical protein